MVTCFALAQLGIVLLYFMLPQLLGIVILLSIGLMASVICAVHHAEVIAHKVGEPFGTLVLVRYRSRLLKWL